MPVFEGVIASLTTKLTMFMPSGLPVRATCGVKIMEAARKFKPERKTRPYRTNLGPPVGDLLRPAMRAAAARMSSGVTATFMCRA